MKGGVNINMELKENEQKKYDAIIKLINNEITIKEASFELDLSRQQIYRLRKKFETQGKEGFIHKNRGKTPVNKMDVNVLKIRKSLSNRVL